MFILKRKKNRKERKIASIYVFIDLFIFRLKGRLTLFSKTALLSFKRSVKRYDCEEK